MANGYEMIEKLSEPPRTFHTSLLIRTLEDNQYSVSKLFQTRVAHRGLKEIEFMKRRCRHPNSCMAKSSFEKREIMVINYEYANGGNLASYLDKTNKCKIHQNQFCKSIVRQLIEYTFHLETVVGTPHRNINPKNILLNQDGIVKMKSHNSLEDSLVRVNPRHYYEGNGYCAPEFRHTVENRMKSDHKGDIWAIGAIAYSIMSGENLMPEWAREDVYPNPEIIKNNDKNTVKVKYISIYGSNEDVVYSIPIIGSEFASPSVEKTKEYLDLDKKAKDKKYNLSLSTCKTSINHQRKYNKFLDFVNKRDSKEWEEKFPDPLLRYIVDKCLSTDRTTSVELLAYIYLNGGYTQHILTEPSSTIRDRQKLTLIPPLEGVYDAWCTDLAGLSRGNSKLFDEFLMDNNKASDIDLLRYSNSCGDRLWGELLFYEISRKDESSIKIMINCLLWESAIQKKRHRKEINIQRREAIKMRSSLAYDACARAMHYFNL